MFNKEMQKEHTYTVDGIINGGGLSGIIYLLANGWAYIRGAYNWGGLKSGILRHSANDTPVYVLKK